MPCTLHKSSHVVFTIMLSRLQYYSHFTDGKTSFARVSSLPEATVHKRCRNSACRVCKLYHFVQLRERGREKGLDGGVGGGWMQTGLRPQQDLAQPHWCPSAAGRLPGSSSEQNHCGVPAGLGVAPVWGADR